MLTGRDVLGVGDASGMFPVDPATRTYDAGMLAAFDGLVAQRRPDLHLAQLLPDVLVAGQEAGHLTADGAALLDPTGELQAGVPFCPPEGDAGTGMVATNAVAPRTGNVSVGTSIFAMVVLERPLSTVHHELDLVTTPIGRPGRDGALQQRRQRARRVGRAVRQVRRGTRAPGRAGRGVRRAAARGAGG